MARIFAGADAGIATGPLFDGGGQLGRLIGRPATTLAQAISAALGG